jgi:hypothetical protein
MTAEKVLHPGVWEEAQKDLPRVAEYHNKCHQRSPRAANLEMSEVSPVDLALFARQAPQTQIGLDLAVRPMAGDEMTEVIPPSLVATFANHSMQPAGGQRRERLQRLTDER